MSAKPHTRCIYLGVLGGDLHLLYFISGAILSPDCVSLVLAKPENDNQCHNVKKSAEEPVNLKDLHTCIIWTQVYTRAYLTSVPDIALDMTRTPVIT
jgi:hypothetical protein